MSAGSGPSVRQLSEALERALPERRGAESARVCRELLDRALALAEAAAASDEAPDPAFLVLGRLADRLNAGGLHEEARRLLAKALQAARDNEPENRFLLAVLHDQLAESLQNEGRSEQAIGHAREAEREGRAACRPGDPRLLGLLNNVGTAFKRAGDFLTAEVYFRRALELADVHGHAPGPLSATAALNLADVQGARGDLDGAVQSAERGLAETEEAYGPASPELADAVADLASLLREAGRVEEALARQRRAVALFELALGPDHQLTSVARRRLEGWEAES